MDLSPSWEDASRSAIQVFTKKVIKSQGSLPCSHGPSSGPYPEADESSPYNTFVCVCVCVCVCVYVCMYK
jgi:hypothetical protein